MERILKISLGFPFPEKRHNFIMMASAGKTSVFISALIGFFKCVEMILLFVIRFATECSQFLGVIHIIIIITDSQNVIFLMIKIKKFNGLFVGQTYCQFAVENSLK